MRTYSLWYYCKQPTHDILSTRGDDLRGSEDTVDEGAEEPSSNLLSREVLLSLSEPSGLERLSEPCKVNIYDI